MSKAATTIRTANVIFEERSAEDLEIELCEATSQVVVIKNKLAAMTRYARKLEKSLGQRAEIKTQVSMLPLQLNFSNEGPKVETLSKAELAKLEEGWYLITISDTHIGTLIKEGSIRSQPHVKFSFETLASYFKEIVVKAAKDIALYPQYNIKGVKVLFNGDLLNGEHLSESVRTNEADIQTTLAKGVKLVTEFLLLLQATLAKLGKNIPIRVTFTAGNHGRWDHNCPSADFAERNYDTYLGVHTRFAIDAVKKVKKSVDIDITVAADHEAIFTIYGKNYLATHGNFAAAEQRIKKARGLGNGLTERLYAYKLGAEVRWGMPIEGLFVGHFHQQINDRRYGVYVNGSPKGYDHYAEKLNLKVEPAMQACHILTRRGVVQSIDINLEQPFRTAEQDDAEMFKQLTKDYEKEFGQLAKYSE